MLLLLNTAPKQQIKGIRKNAIIIAFFLEANLEMASVMPAKTMPWVIPDSKVRDWIDDAQTTWKKVIS